MKKHVSIALVMALALCVTVTYEVGHCGAADPVDVTTTPCYFKFKGFTTLKTTGGVGPRQMNNLCKSKYGSYARMCTSAEIIRSYYHAPESNAVAWVNPTSFQLVYRPDTDPPSWLAIDTASGIGASGEDPDYARRHLNCGDWNQDWTGMTGLSYHLATGFTLTVFCNEDIPVACCSYK